MRPRQPAINLPRLLSQLVNSRSEGHLVHDRHDMKAFADLYTLLDETTKTTAKVRALKNYFTQVPAEDAAWAVYFLIGRKPRQVVPSGKLRAWAAEEAGVSAWLFQESYDAVGDVAETIALLLPPPERSSDSP